MGQRSLAFIRRLRAIPAALAVAAAIVAAGTTGAAEGVTSAAPPVAVVLQVEGAIGPATAGYLTDGLEEAAAKGAGIVIIRMDTPGGLSASMREIIHAILASPVPVATFVAPRGARAASAGTYILYASHVAAMAPGTTLGAATPVQLGGGGGSPLPGGGEGDSQPGSDGGAPDTDGTEGEQAGGEPRGEGDAPKDAKTAKAVNDAAAYIRALAELRGRNADWAEKAVREAATLTVDEAVARNVVDLKAADIPELLERIDGRRVELEEREVTLSTAGARVEEAPPDWRDELLALLTNPNVAFIFMMLGVYGLIFELSNPGVGVPGVLGAICLMIGLYALNVLPVNYAGLALLALGIAFMTAEAFVPSFGALGIGGLAAFALGATILFDTGTPAFELSIWTVVGVTALTGAVLVLLIGYLVRAQRRPVATGEETLVGRTAKVDSWTGGRGRVWLNGELWNAEGPAALDPGTQVRVVAATGLTLTVAPAARTPESKTAGESG